MLTKFNLVLKKEGKHNETNYMFKREKKKDFLFDNLITRNMETILMQIIFVFIQENGY